MDTEDSIDSHLYRKFILKNPGAIHYNSTQGGALINLTNPKFML